MNEWTRRQMYSGGGQGLKRGVDGKKQRRNGKQGEQMKETPGDILNVAQKNDYRLPSSDGCTQPTQKTAKPQE